jgi:hypothetical protein
MPEHIKDELLDKLKLETKEIKDVEIIHTGNFKGREYTDKDLDMFIENFNNKIVEPVLTIDHDPELTDKVSKEFKVSSLGYVDKLKRIGNRLYADFKQVPKLISDLIEAGTIKQRSIEFFKTFRTSAGKVLNNVLTGVTFFGNGIPAVSGMSDLMNFFKEDIAYSDIQSDAQKCDDETESINFKESEMDNVTIPKQEYETLLKIKAESEQAIKFKEDVAIQIEAFKTETESLKAKLEASNKISAEYEQYKTDQIKKEAEDYVTLQINSKKLLPKFKDYKVSEYINLKNDEKKLEIFKSEIESRPDMIPENYHDTSVNSASKEEFKTVENMQPEYDRLLKQGKTSAEAFDMLGIK